MTPPPGELVEGEAVARPSMTPRSPRPSLRRAVVTALRRLLQSIVAFTCLFVFVRTIFLEPFGVPTGSMAGRFYGNHRECDCPRCGGRVVVGEPGAHDRNVFADAVCPNCGEKKISLNDARDIPGDRLMVDKNVFNMRSPRRWEIAVFRCPVDDSKPYVKRVVGLPGEAVLIQGGDVFANSVLLRKTLMQCRELWLPVYDYACAPAGGWGPRWFVERPGDAAAAVNAGPEIMTESAITLNATEKPLGLTYRHVNLDTMVEEAVTDWLAYNGSPRSRRGQPVHDFAVTFDLEVKSGAGMIALRLQDGGASAFVELPINSADLAKLGRDRAGGDDSTEQYAVALKSGKTHRIEFALIDRRAHVSVDGATLGVGHDLPGDLAVIGRRGSVSRPVQIGAASVHCVLHNFKILRDVHYRADGVNGTGYPFQLGQSSYFMLGDNSNNSNDSRDWSVAGVPLKDFLGKPFLIHQPLKLGRMTVAGQERQFQAIDWPRLGWVR